MKGDDFKHTLIIVVLFALLGASMFLVLDTFLDISQPLTFAPLGGMALLLVVLGILLPGYIRTSPYKTTILLLVFDAFLVFGVIASVVLILLVQTTIPGSLLLLYALRFLSTTGGLTLLGLFGRDIILNSNSE